MSEDTGSDLQRLKHTLKDDDLDEDLGIALLSLITAAVHDKDPKHDLGTVVAAIQKNRCASFLEPLSIIPIVVESSEVCADELMDLIAKECSAKEVLMAAEEALENIDQRLQARDDDEISEEERRGPSPAKQVIRLVNAYSAAIPRLQKWKKSPGETLESRLSELECVISLVSQDASSEEGSFLITAISQLALSLGNTADEKAKELLRHIIEHTSETFANSVNGGLARKAFTVHFSRLVVLQSEPNSNSGSHEDTMTSTWSALRALGYNEGSYESHPSLASFILLAHHPTYTFSEPELTAFLPIILSSIQTNVALDEVLAVLLSSLATLRQKTPRPELSPDFIVPLVHLLPFLASNHSDQDIRHYAFRILSLVLNLSPSPIRLRLLEDLLGDEDLPPQMRVAAVGLLKEAVLEGLSSPNKNLFASPRLLTTFGPVVLRPDPPDLFDSVLLDQFLDSPEPLRLVESLGFYYVLLMRDVHNRTGVRDTDSLCNVERSLLQPLRGRLRGWREDLSNDKDSREELEHVHDGAMQLDILDMWLERAQDAIDNLTQ